MGRTGTTSQPPSRSVVRRKDGRPAMEKETKDPMPRAVPLLNEPHPIRMYVIANAINEAIFHATSMDDLYQRICQAAAGHDNSTSLAVILPRARLASAKVAEMAGKGAQHLGTSHFLLDQHAPETLDLVGISFHTQACCVSNDILNDRRAKPWHGPAKKSDLRQPLPRH